MRTVVFLFPGAWGNDTPERVLWWFRHQVTALLAIDPSVEIVPVTYRGRTFDEIVENVLVDLCTYPNNRVRRVALAYSMGRQVVAGALDFPNRARFDRVAHIAGVPSYGVPVAGTFDVFRAAPAFLVRSFGGTVMPRDAEEANAIMCSGSDPELARELLRHMAPESMWWKVAHLFLPGMRVRTNPIGVPTHAVLGTRDLIVGKADYDGDNLVDAVRVGGGHHALICSCRPDLRNVWNRQSRFLLEA